MDSERLNRDVRHESTFARDQPTMDEQRQLRKDFPATKDWPKFNGEGEYNHHDFVDWVDQNN